MRIYYFPFDDLVHKYEIFQVLSLVAAVYMIIFVASWLYTKIGR